MIIELISLFLVFVILISLSLLIFKSVVAPIGLYAFIWSGVFTTAILFEYDYRFSPNMYYAFTLSWACFTFGCLFFKLIYYFRTRGKYKTVRVEIIDSSRLREVMVYLSLSGLLFSVIYIYEMFNLLSLIELQNIRGYIYAESADVGSRVITRHWYIYNVGLAVICLGAIIGSIYIARSKDQKNYYKVCSITPIISVFLFSIAEMSRGRIMDVMTIYILVILLVQYKGSIINFIKDKYQFIFILLSTLLYISSLITAARGVDLKEGMVSNLFANVGNYVLVSVVAFNESLTGNTHMGLRAIIYPLFYLLEKVGLISVGGYPDPTKLTSLIAYPTPTYLFWLFNGYGFISIMAVPFIVGLISSYLFSRFRIYGGIKYLMFYVISCILIIFSVMTWRLFDLWYCILIISVIPISNYIVIRRNIKEEAPH